MTLKTHAIRAWPAALAIVLASAQARADSMAEPGGSTPPPRRVSAERAPRASYVPPWLVALEALRANESGNIAVAHDVRRHDDDNTDRPDEEAPAASAPVLERIVETLDDVPLFSELAIEGIRIETPNGSRTVTLTVMPTKMQGGNGIVAKGRF